jgi:outer membrane protein assembly factor BamB
MRGARARLLLHICRLLLPVLLLPACSKPDPILEGVRTPVFAKDEIKVLNKKPTDIGADITPEKCDFTIDGNNQIWRDGARIFAGLPTESEIKVEKKAACRGEYVYAGLSTGELVKVDSETRDLEWTADIFAGHVPTGGAPFLDIIATPVHDGEYVYAGGLGNAFCKIKDSDGSKAWCLPVGVREILKSTKKFHFVLTADDEVMAVSADGRVYMKEKIGGKENAGDKLRGIIE